MINHDKASKLEAITLCSDKFLWRIWKYVEIDPMCRAKHLGNLWLRPVMGERYRSKVVFHRNGDKVSAYDI